MSTTRTIALTPYIAKVARFGNAASGAKAMPKERYRWRAELVERGQVVLYVEGFESPDDALGTLVTALAAACESPADVVELIGGLFGDVGHKPAGAQLGRAIRIANRHPNRRHPGCVVTIAEPAAADPAARTVVSVKGGVR